MPASQTITSFYSFTAGTVIKSAEVNTMFSLFRGHLMPIDGSTTAFANQSYDLGSSSFKWKHVYGDPILPVISTTGSYTLLAADSVLLSNCTGATTTVTLPAVASVPTGKQYTIKHIGSANTVLVDGNGAETIDGSITAEMLTPMESMNLVSNGSAWYRV